MTMEPTPFHKTLSNQGIQSFTRAPLTELQINLGKLCNQACHHCHVDAGPKRTEIMSLKTMNKILEWTTQTKIKKVDLTGGAPELNPNFRYFVDSLQTLGSSITSRCNITVLFERGQEDLARWYRDRKIRLICSLPCYTKGNVDAQRGNGVFEKSIAGLQRLNSQGYGIDPGLSLDLVYNPGGPFLPPDQATLEGEYKNRLKDDFGISFNHLFTITNLPINRFAHALRRDGQYDQYMTLLTSNFNLDTVEGLMCKHLISVNWLGHVYDCDFNQMLELPMANKPLRHLWDLAPDKLTGAPIATDDHCYGCTAGNGSSCGGSLT